jgi:DNA polymerase-3 subunit chi
VTATQVDFYLLSASDARTRLLTACRLAEKAFDNGRRVSVRTTGPAETAELDDLMWTFSDRSFVPHAVWPAGDEVAAETPVLISTGEPPESHCDVLVNLGTEVPAGFERYARLCEIVTGDEAAKAAGRARWRRYRDAGLAPQSHPL